MKKKLLSTLALLCLTVTSAWAQSEEWSGEKEFTVTPDNPIQGPVYVIENTILTISSGATVTVNGGIVISEGKTLTIEGGGELKVYGSGGSGGQGNGGNGGNGSAAFKGNVIIYSGTVIAKGGNGGGAAGGADHRDDQYVGGGDGGRGGDGGTAFDGSVTIYGGIVTGNGGNGGDGNDGGEGGQGYHSDGGSGGCGGEGGNGSYALAGKMTFYGGTVTVKGGNGGAGGDGGVDLHYDDGHALNGPSGNSKAAMSSSNLTIKAETYQMFDGNNQPVTSVAGLNYVKITALDAAICMEAHLAKGAYWSTFYSGVNNYQAPEGTQVFTADLNYNNETLSLSEVENRIVKNGEGVVLKQPTTNTQLETIIIPMLKTAAESSYDWEDNDLGGRDEVLTVNGENNYYVLNYMEANDVGFYNLASGGTIGAHKAFLLTGNVMARPFFGFDEEATGISAVQQRTEELAGGEWFDLQGRPVAHPTKGLYIVRQGKSRKVVVGN